jgi:hypothetical protein
MRPSRLLASTTCTLSSIVALATSLHACSEAPAASRSSQAGERYGSLYDDSTLAYWKTRYEPNIRYNLDSLILPLLTTREEQAVGNLSLELPLRDDRDPLAYYVLGPPPTIVVSILSIKFLDDLAIASAWLATNDYSVESMAYYADVLKYRRASDFTGNRYPAPLHALGIPANALSDKEVDFISQEVLKGTIVFTLAHEIGHVVGRHSPNVTIDVRRRYEMDADRFAIDVFRRMGLAPVSIVPFFLIATHLQWHRGDFQTEREWMAWQREQASHPLSGQRLRALASELRRAPGEFARNLANPTRAVGAVRSAARQIDSIAPLLDDELLQRHAAIVGRQIPLGELRPRRAGQTWIPRD